MEGMNFERFWLNVRFKGASIAEKYKDRPIWEQRMHAANAFELWRLGKLQLRGSELLTHC